MWTGDGGDELRQGLPAYRYRLASAQDELLPAGESWGCGESAPRSRAPYAGGALGHHESTPAYFAGANRQASTHYYADSDGDWYQMVPERCAAIANGLRGKPRPSWADPATSLNWQTLSVEIEGYAATIHQHCTPGTPQWDSVVRWVEDRTRVHGIPLDRAHVIGHYEVADNRSDPGRLDIQGIVDAALALREQEDEMTFIGIAYAPPESGHLKTYEMFVASDGSLKRKHIPTKKRRDALVAMGLVLKRLTQEELAQYEEL